MATKKKMLQAAAGQAGGATLDITDVFSTYLYEGNGSIQTITNGIDLAGEGGMVWSKSRTVGDNHRLTDTERGANKTISTDATYAEYTNVGVQSATQFNSNGFVSGLSDPFFNGESLVSWTFRKAPKFFDVVTWTGDGTTNRAIPHGLGTTVGTIIVKVTSSASDWLVWHRSNSQNAGTASTDSCILMLNSTEGNGANAYSEDGEFPTVPTDTNFYVGNNTANINGVSYVAYLFAHNNGDGGFGPDGDQDIIKCGSYTGNGSTNGPVIDLGFEPQWLLTKAASRTSDWTIVDNMRGAATGGFDARLHPQSNEAEAFNADIVDFLADGFQPTNTGTLNNGNGETYIYMAIRRGPLAQPESATDVFEVFETTNTGTASTIGSMGPSDFILNKRTDAAATWRALDRLRGGSMLRTDSTDTETSSGFLEWDKMGGVFVTTQGAPFITNDAQAHWMWKRAPGFFDVVAYTGTGSAMTVSHNLGVAPEMMWVKKRSSADNWRVYHSDIGIDYQLGLDSSSAKSYDPAIWNGTDPTSTVFSLGNDSSVIGSGSTFIAYLFATVPGVSKVGSYTGTGATLNIDCGFTSGARFILIRRTDSNGDWMLFDTERGVVSGNDPFLMLNESSAENSGQDLVDPYSSGFTLTNSGNGNVNGSGGSYIFYAIA